MQSQPTVPAALAEQADEPADEPPEASVEQSQEGSQAHQAFRPFFTIIASKDSDGVTRHSHPHVHYMFSDDEPDLLTAALLHRLDYTDAAEPQTRRPCELVIDIADNGYEVTGVHSLDGTWQAMRVSLTSAPSFDAEGEERELERGLMLRIEGTTVSDENGAGDVLLRRDRGRETKLIEEANEVLRSAYVQAGKTVADEAATTAKPDYEHMIKSIAILEEEFRKLRLPT